jgi:D-amino-acid dehydrogenase
MQSVTILGAGVVGVTAAWYLAAEGFDVTVIDRQPLPAQETSFANGGQISVSHAEPWANPGALRRIVKWLGHEDAPLLWRWRADWDQWRWGLAFLRECSAAKTRANIRSIVQLGLMSRTELGALREALALQYDQLTRGILHIYTDGREFEHALQQAALMREFGCDRTPRTTAECLSIEPALKQSTLPVVGGTYTAADESGDAQLFTARLAEKAAAAGVRFRFEETVTSLVTAGKRVTGVRLATNEVVSSAATVLALGSYSSLLLRPLGVRLPVYPGKGYSATFQLVEDQPANAGNAQSTTRAAPAVSLTDDQAKIVFSRLGNRLRVAGTAEFTGYDLNLNAARCTALVRRTQQLFPDLPTAGEIEYWTGLRPVTPSNVPLIGSLAQVGVEGLWLNTGHGTLGWTLACGSARLLADLMTKREPAVDARPYQF